MSLSSFALWKSRLFAKRITLPGMRMLPMTATNHLAKTVRICPGLVVRDESHQMAEVHGLPSIFSDTCIAIPIAGSHYQNVIRSRHIAVPVLTIRLAVPTRNVGFRQVLL